MFESHLIRPHAILLASVLLLLGGCGTVGPQRPLGEGSAPRLTPVTQSYRDLVSLPPPKGKIVAAVYGFRDMTGQYKPAPDSSFSTAVTQGATSMLVKAMLDSQWFIPVEREGLQNLLTERKIDRATEKQLNRNVELAPLLSAKVMLEGGVVAYETNVRTGGAGAKYFGVGASELYRTDQVTVNLRAVDLQTGRILNSISTTKTVLSQQVDVGVFRFVKFKRLLEMEAGYSVNEPAQMCVNDAIEAALVHLIAQGIQDNNWALKNPEDIRSPVLEVYLAEQKNQLSAESIQSRKTLNQEGGEPERSNTFLD